MHYLLYGLIGFIIILLEEYFLGVYIDFSLTNLAIVIIPIGGIILGFIMGLLLHFGMLKGRTKYGAFLITLTIIIGFLLYPSIQYMEYKTTFYQYDSSTDSYLINRKFEGNPIEDLEISFLEYEKQLLDNQNITITGKRNMSLELPTAGFLNYINLLLNWLCMALACIVTFRILAKDTKYCESCKKYYSEDKLFKFLPNAYDNTMKEIAENLNTINEYAKEHDVDVTNYRDYYQTYHVYCPKCQTGEIQIRHMVTKDNSFEEDENSRIIIPISN